MKFVHIKLITAVALFTCVMTALLTLHHHVIFYQEQHALFLYSRSYFEATIHSKGLLGYIGAFMVQFYYYPWLGAAITSGLLTGVYLFTEGIIYRLTGLRDFLQLGVAGATGLYFTLDGLEDSPAWAAIAFVGTGIIWLTVSWIVKPRRKTRINARLSFIQILIPVILAGGYIIGGFEIVLHGYNRPERAMIRAERAIKQKKWDEAIQITSQYLSTGRVNKLMLYLRSLALAQKGELIDHMFDYPQKVGQQALSFPWNSDSREAEYGHWVHEATGDINAAHQWAFEAMTAWGETAPHLIDLGRYNVALGRPKVALKFANKLSQSLFYKKEAESIRRQVNGEEPIMVKYAEPDSVKIKWVNIYDFRPNLMQNYNANPDDSITRQYLIASMLLGNNLRDLIPILKPEDLDKRNIKQAILIYSLDPQAIPLSEYGMGVDDATGRDFSRFYNMLKRTNPAEPETSYGDTYWYYKHVLYSNEEK